MDEAQKYPFEEFLKLAMNMEWLAGVLAVVTGLIVRLALPVGVSLVAIYFLRKLDARWQDEARSEGAQVQIPSERIRCWEVKDCPPDRRSECPAFSSTQPCWQAHRQPNGYLLEDCLGCEVFREMPLPPASAHA
jgi:hypothetical protein